MEDSPIEAVVREQRTYRFFEISILLKGANAVLEIAGGLLALLISPALVQGVTAYFTNEELGQDPNDFIATHLVKWADAYTSGPHQHFIALYLLSHGIIKIVLVVALLRGATWAFPAAIGVFTAFFLYQVYLLIEHYSFGMLALTFFDLVVIYFVWREWQVLKAHQKV